MPRRTVLARFTAFSFSAIPWVITVLGLAWCTFASGYAQEVTTPSLWPSLPAPIRAPGLDAFVDRMIAQMTLEEKVGQMIQADIASTTPEDVRTYRLGSILAGGNAAPGGKLRSTPEAWALLTDRYRAAALGNAGIAHRAIPILFGIDAVHGNAKVLGATIFPHNVGLGAAHDPDLIRRIGQATAQEVAAIGIDWAFAPTVAVARDVRWGRSYESYAEDPREVADYAAAMVDGMQGTWGSPLFMSSGHVLSSVKHFLGDGGTDAGRDQGNTMVSEAELSQVHGAGYPAAIKAGALIVMASYNSWNGVKMHANHYLLTDILKGRFGFQGFVVGDWNAQEQVPGCTKLNCAMAILAGVDMLMAPDGWKRLYLNTVAEVRSGEIPGTRIDDAVSRILRVKALAGLFGANPSAATAAASVAEPVAASGATAAASRANREPLEVIGSAAHRAIAREAVRKSLVLLKNNGHVLPLAASAHVLVAGRAADDIGMQSGGWTIDWQGDHNSNRDFPGATSIYAGIKAAVTRGGGSAVLRRDGRFTHMPDAAIVVMGERPYAEFEGDRENLDFSADDPADLELLKSLQRRGVPTVTVFLSGRPLWINPILNASDALVAAWLPGSEGEGIADVLISSAPGQPRVDFTGRLPFSWPATALPVTFDPAGTVSGALFARDFGLDDQSSVETPQLPIDPGALGRSAAPDGSLFHAGHATAPWSLFVADGGAEVHVTTQRQASPHGVVSLTLDADGATAAWNGSDAGAVRISGRAQNLAAAAHRGLALDIRYRVNQAPTRMVELGVRCTSPLCKTPFGALLDVTSVFKDAAAGTWTTLILPLACLQQAGADLSEVVAPFVLASTGRLNLTLAEVRLRTAAVAKPGCPSPSTALSEEPVLRR
jgi:beta-glucosidase